MMLYRSACGVACVLCSTLAVAEEFARNDRAIAEVVAGSRTDARASWWGFNAEDATAALQAAINSPARRLIVDKQSGPWIVDEIRLRSDLEIVFEPGVEVLARKGAFVSPSASLFTATDCQNLRMVGPQAVLRMRRSDYAKPPYAKGEWRHVLNLRGCVNVLVDGLTLAESGGDGIYIARGNTRKQCEKVTIRNVICERNYRQGISVISAEDLTIENCTLRATGGTAPEAGIDFEPNHPDERLVNCLMRDCVIEDNEGYGIHIYARPLDGSTADMSIRFERCITRGTNSRSASVVTSNGGPKGTVKGRVEFIDCQFRDRGNAGVIVGSKPVNGASLLFRDCEIRDAGTSDNSPTPIVFNSRLGDEFPVGGVAFENLGVTMRGDSPLIRFDDRVGLELGELKGQIALQRDSLKEVVALGPDSLDRLIPSNAFVRVPAIDPAQQMWTQPADKLPPSQSVPHRLRDHAEFWLWAKQGENVECELKYQHVGKGTNETMAVRVIDPAGKPLSQQTIPLDTSGTVSFITHQSGVHRIVCEPRSHTVQLSRCGLPFCVSGRACVLHFVHTVGDVFFLVPAGVKQVAIRAQGEGDGERVTLCVSDETGREIWKRENLAGAEYQIVARENSSQPAVWRCRMSRPTQGVLEDHYLEIRGIPPLISFSPGSLLQPTNGN